MPVPDHTTIGRLLADFLARYTAAEADLFGRLAADLGRGIDTQDWDQRKLSELTRFSRGVERVVTGLDASARRDTPRILRRVVTDAHQEAARQAARAGVTSVLPAGTTSVVAQTGEAIVGSLAPVHARIFRATLDIYRVVIARTVSSVTLGALTRRQAAQKALDTFATRGVTGFVDRAGRHWDLASYTEMALRTGTAHAAVDAHTTTLMDSGLDLVVVSNAPQECEICRPWEGQILSLSGATGSVAAQDPVTGRAVTVTVKASLSEARAAGLYHPNCRHSHSVYLPGVTHRPTGTADVEGDAARQQLRYLERQVRAWKRREVVALDRAAAVRARARAAGYERRIKSHVASSLAKRQPQREKIGVAR